MTKKIVLLNGSRKLNTEIPLQVIAEIARLRPIEVEFHECPDFLQHFIDKAYVPRRKQVNAYELTNLIHQTKAMQDRYEAGKLIIVDEDAYSGDEDCNWFFGAHSKVPNSLGYLFVSTARMQSENHAKDILRHESGHMFGAPSQRRSNTYELWGLHCSNPLCVMQQKSSVAESVKYAQQRAKAGSSSYCSQCEEDIKEFERD